MSTSDHVLTPPSLEASRRAELLAPAGDRTCLRAAIENGADAVYFGLKDHNARARAANFDVDELPGVMSELHRAGVRGYVALNTLVFPRELGGVETLVRRVAEAGVDALIVQDLGLCRLIRAITPDLEIHASTQMSITSVEGIRLAQELGCSRVILARELSLAEIARIQRDATLPVEVFVHGALCVAYSGQCLTSEALGGRSANRGECAQACRMDYQIICDEHPVDLGDIRYLLSPQDLAAYDLIPKLVELGVASLKIEGRLKTPEYVANITSHYRRALDEALAGRTARFDATAVRDMELSFSRGFSHGFLDGNNHKVLVRGDYAKKRGIFLGTVRGVSAKLVTVDLAAPVKPGDGLVFDGDERRGIPEQGGRVYDVRPVRPGIAPTDPASGAVNIGFGARDLNPHCLVPGQRVWKTDDPELTRRLRASFQGNPQRLVDLDIDIELHVGMPIALRGVAATGFEAVVRSALPLVRADRHPASPESIRAGLDRLGGTAYRLRRVSSSIEGGPLVPKSVLNALRRDLVAALDSQARESPARALAAGPVLPLLKANLHGESQAATSARPRPASLSVLCRSPEQAQAAVESGAAAIALDFQDIKRYAECLARVRSLSTSAKIYLATPRIQKPGEAPIFRFLSRLGADGLLVRNAGGLLYCGRWGIPFVADFSLNAANELAVAYLLSKGAERVTASYDLSLSELLDLVREAPTDRLEIVIHQHMPLFHMEHCVFCAFLSPGTDKTNCGRPCDEHSVRLRDRVGMDHPLTADVGCRNTLFNGVPQTTAEFLPKLIAAGVRHFRVELLTESAASTSRLIGLYQETLDGRRDGRTLWKDLRATNRYGVTRGQLAVL